MRTGEDYCRSANGCRPNRLGTEVGMLDIQVPKTSDYGYSLFYLTTKERSKRCSLAVLSAILVVILPARLKPS